MRGEQLSPQMAGLATQLEKQWAVREQQQAQAPVQHRQGGIHCDMGRRTLNLKPIHAKPESEIIKCKWELLISLWRWMDGWMGGNFCFSFNSLKFYLQKNNNKKTTTHAHAYVYVVILCVNHTTETIQSHISLTDDAKNRI